MNLQNEDTSKCLLHINKIFGFILCSKFHPKLNDLSDRRIAYPRPSFLFKGNFSSARNVIRHFQRKIFLATTPSFMRVDNDLAVWDCLNSALCDMKCATRFSIYAIRNNLHCGNFINNSNVTNVSVDQLTEESKRAIYFKRFVHKQ